MKIKKAGGRPGLFFVVSFVTPAQAGIGAIQCSQREPKTNKVQVRIV